MLPNDASNMIRCLLEEKNGFIGTVGRVANRRPSGSSDNADFELTFLCIALESARFERLGI